MKTVDCSIIIPVMNEEKAVKELSISIGRVMKSLAKSYEIIFIDDGSTDNTINELLAAKKIEKNIKVIVFQKNFRKAAAYSAGFKEASGSVIITMDGDLQDNPYEIPKLLEKLKDCDLVVGWKKNRRDSLARKFASKLFNILIYFLFGVRLHDSDCGFRAMKKEVAKKLKIYSGLYRFIPIIASQMGYKIGEVAIKHEKRRYGRSKYGVSRLMTGTFDLIAVKFLTKYFKNPLQFFGLAGVASFLLGIIAEIYVLYFRIVKGDLFATHMPMLILGVLLLILGVQLISIGLIGEMISYHRREEDYIIKKFL